MDETTFHELLQRGTKYNASDALFKVGQPPAFRVGGDLHYLQGEKLRPEHTSALAEIVLKRSRRTGDLTDLMEYDTAYSVSGVGRYRVNIYRQRGTIALALRRIPLEIPSFDKLGLPPVVKTLCEFERGMVLVVGAAGNGKSSTLASMIGHLNQTRRAHIVTIEDPIEFLHQDALATISQREIGLDTPGLPHCAQGRVAPRSRTSSCLAKFAIKCRWTSRSRPPRRATSCWRRCIPQMSLAPWVVSFR